MTHKLIFLTFFLFFTQLVGAQTSERPKGYISVSAGVAIPLGTFAKSDDIYNDGYAKTGFNINALDIGYRFGKRFGISTYLSIASFPFNGVALGHSEQTQNILNVEAKAKPMKQNSLLIGPTYSFFLKKFEFQLNILVGFSLVESHDIEQTNWLRASYSGLKYYSTRTSLRSHAFATCLSFSSRYPINENWFLSLEIKYNQAFHKNLIQHNNPQIIYNITDYTIPSFDEQPTAYEQSMNYSSLNFNLGIGYMF